jgi:hypothetical protein
MMAEVGVSISGMPGPPWGWGDGEGGGGAVRVRPDDDAQRGLISLQATRLER